MHDIFIGNVYQWLIWEKHIKCVIYDQICEPLHFLLYFRGYFERVQSNPYYLHHHGIVCRLWTFNVAPLIGIIRLTLSWLSAVHGPSRKLMSPLGVGSGCVTLPRGDRSSVPRGGPRPATRSIRRPVGTLTQHVADGIIRSIARISAVRT